jgi:hypothetical protein
MHFMMHGRSLNYTVLYTVAPALERPPPTRPRSAAQRLAATIHHRLALGSVSRAAQALEMQPLASPTAAPRVVVLQVPVAGPMSTFALPHLRPPLSSMLPFALPPLLFRAPCHTSLRSSPPTLFPSRSLAAVSALSLWVKHGSASLASAS